MNANKGRAETRKKTLTADGRRFTQIFSNCEYHQDIEPTVAGQVFSMDYAVIEAQNHICVNLRSSAVRFGFFFRYSFNSSLFVSIRGLFSRLHLRFGLSRR
jgi:hypothetical protein